jgi:hypothetical protein
MMKCYSKGYKWKAREPRNSHKPLKPVKANHTSLVVIIEGQKWLCDPTWGSGTLLDGEEVSFNSEYNRSRFLVPLVCGLNDHFPTDGCESLLHEPLPYERFIRSPAYVPNEFVFRNESHPFCWFPCESGYLRMQFSTTTEVTQSVVKCCDARARERREIDGDLQAVELFQKTDDRLKFWLHAAFPKPGLYELRLLFSGRERSHELQSIFLVESRAASAGIPFLRYDALADSAFVPIVPRAGLAPADGIAVIRFAIAVGRAKVEIIVLDPHGAPVEGIAKYVQLTIPFDETRYETVATVSFPADGRWMVRVNSAGEQAPIVTYRFDVAGADGRVVSPIEYVEADRQFAPMQLPQGLEVLPKWSVVVVHEPDIELTVKASRSPTVYVRKVHGGQTPPLGGVPGRNGRMYKYQLPEFGDYEVVYLLARGRYEQQWRYTEQLRPEPNADAAQRMRRLQGDIQGGRVDPEYEKFKARSRR